MQQWEQSPTFDAYNPNQIVREPNNTWSGSPQMTTGNYSSMYFNRVPVTVQNLEGLRGRGLAGSFSFTTLDPSVQMLLVFVVAGAAGFFGMKYGGKALGFKGKRAG